MINKWVRYDCAVFLFSQSDPVFASSILLIEKKKGDNSQIARKSTLQTNGSYYSHYIHLLYTVYD